MITLEFTETLPEINIRDVQTLEQVSSSEQPGFGESEDTQEWVRIMKFIEEFLTTHRDIFEELARR